MANGPSVSFRGDWRSRSRFTCRRCSSGSLHRASGNPTTRRPARDFVSSKPARRRRPAFIRARSRCARERPITYAWVSYATVGLEDRWRQPPDDVRLMRELEPVVERELNRHLGVAKEWFPHEYVPWSEGTDFDGPYAGQAWDPEQSRMDEVSRNSLDRQPADRGQPAQLPPRDRRRVRPRRRLGHLGPPLDRRGGPARHRDPRLPARDPRRRPGRARAGPHAAHGHRLHSTRRRRHAAVGRVRVLPGARHPRLPPQHRSASPAIPVCDQLLARIAADENLHMLFYRNLLAAAFDLAPTETMRAVTDVVRDFQMPGQPSRTSPASRCRSPWPASTTCASTTTRCSHPCSGPGTSGTDPASGPTATRPGRNSRCSCPASTQLPRDSNRNAPPASSVWPRQPDPCDRQPPLRRQHRRGPAPTTSQHPSQHHGGRRVRRLQTRFGRDNRIRWVAGREVGRHS